MECKAVTTPDSMWSFCPSLGPSILFLVLFILTTAAHIIQGIYYRKPYCWVITVSGLCQLLTYVFRTASILNPDRFSYYAAWFILILIAPLWTNAFVYMTFGRMVWNFKPDHQVGGIRASRFTLIFVILDIIAFLVQIGGAIEATGRDAPYDTIMMGLHIYMGGVGIQQLFILIFCFFSFRLFLSLRRDKKGHKNIYPGALPLLYTLFAALVLITVRIIFRICEYSQGLHTQIPNHEAYQYCLDTLPMFIALVLFNVIHPGRIMAGEESEIPSFRERRRERKQRNQRDGEAVELSDR